MSVTLRRPAVWALLAALAGCGFLGGPLPHERKAADKEKQKRLAQLEEQGLVIGEFALARKAVVDGDTVKVDGLDSSLRLLGVNTEETFKKDKEWRAYEVGWEEYKKNMRGSSLRPVKYATPVGMDAKEFAHQFFDGVDHVRLERDHPKEIRDYYNRYLAYIIVEKNGKTLNYNIEAVRAGMSPYFTKYGISRRFHDEFVAAQEEAMAAKIGIWDDSKEHYDDYEERLPWWNRRADFIGKFEAEAEGKENWIVLTNWDAMKRLEDHVGEEVVLLGSVSEVKRGDKGPTRVTLSRKRGNDFPLIFFDKDVFMGSDIERYKGEYVRVRGFVSKYKNKRKKKYELQIVIETPGQIEGAPTTAEETHASP